MNVDAVLDHPGVTAAVRDATGGQPTDYRVAVGRDEAEVGSVADIPVFPWGGAAAKVALPVEIPAA
jgi:hypothetical protein